MLNRQTRDKVAAVFPARAPLATPAGAVPRTRWVLNEFFDASVLSAAQATHGTAGVVAPLRRIEHRRLAAAAASTGASSSDSDSSPSVMVGRGI